MRKLYRNSACVFSYSHFRDSNVYFEMATRCSAVFIEPIAGAFDTCHHCAVVAVNNPVSFGE